VEAVVVTDTGTALLGSAEGFEADCVPSFVSVFIGVEVVITRSFFVFATAPFFQDPPNGTQLLRTRCREQ